MAQLTKLDRQEIEYYLKKDYGPTMIGFMIKRSKSVVSTEIKRNSVNGVYNAEKAHMKAYQRRYWVMTESQKIRSQPELVEYIEVKLKQLNPWSPETIAARWNQERAPTAGFTITFPTIYEYLYLHRPSLCKYLCQKRFKKKRHKNTTQRVMIPNRVPITERPKIVEKRERIGDWEGDTIASVKDDKTAILVLHDRASRYIRVSKTKDITKKRMIPKVKKLLKNLPQQTLTLDNGIEFKGHQHFGIQTFFCQPYASWEKGAVEYSNRLIRRHFPKKTRLQAISPQKLALIVHAINNTPRKCLKYKTPHQVFFSNS
jgi:transposase, IS30 family